MDRKIEESEIGNPKVPSFILDQVILNSLQQKYQTYFDEHDEMLVKKFGDLFNSPITAKKELLSYFKDLELRDDLLQGKTVLDVGASTHCFDDYCSQKYDAEVVAIDVDSAEFGDKHDLGAIADVRALPFAENSFDLVVSHASMPHVLVPHIDDEQRLVPLDGEMRKKVIADVLSMFKESYRVVRKGGQIRMSTFSEKELILDIKNGEYNGIEMETNAGTWVPLDEVESSNQTLDRIKLIKEVLLIFEKESGAKCIFKDEKRGGLIIISKV